MIYLFAADDGSVIERDYPMGKAPKIGKSIRVDGRPFKRIPSLGVEASMVNNVDHMTSVQCPLNWPYAPGHDARGQPRFKNYREVRESIARAKHAGEPIAWD